MQKIAEIKRNTCLETLHNFTSAAKRNTKTMERNEKK